MGLFSKTPSKTSVTPRPSIDETSQFIEWMLRYHESMEYLRTMFVPQALETMVPAITKDMMKTLETCSSAAELMDKLSLFGEAYEKIQPIIKKRGGFSKCPQEIQSYFIDITAKMSILPYFLKYKYGDSVYFDHVGLKKL